MWVGGAVQTTYNVFKTYFRATVLLQCFDDSCRKTQLPPHRAAYVKDSPQVQELDSSSIILARMDPLTRNYIVYTKFKINTN